jgi:hypothetical protein
MPGGDQGFGGTQSGNQGVYPGYQGFPGSQPGFPGAQQPYPGAQQPYPGPQQPYPGAQQPYPGAQQPYPGAQQPYPGPQQPYPGYPGGQPGPGQAGFAAVGQLPGQSLAYAARRRGMRLILTGAGLLVFGILITVISYNVSSSSGGGSYIISFLPISGIIVMIRGFMAVSRANKLRQ